MNLPENLEINVSELKYDGQGLYKRVATKSSVGDKETPIYIHIDSDTDWAAVVPAGAGVVVALLVAWLTIGVQRTQIQGSVSNFRHHWMTELRHAASELIVTLRLIANGCCKKDEFKKTDAYWEYSKAALQMHSKVSLLLSRDDPFSNALREEGGVVVRRVLRTQRRDSEFQLLLSEIDAYQNALREELEEAWADAKNDLGFNRKFLLFRLFRTEESEPARTPFQLSDAINWDAHR